MLQYARGIGVYRCLVEALRNVKLLAFDVNTGFVDAVDQCSVGQMRFEVVETVRLRE